MVCPRHHLTCCTRSAEGAVAKRATDLFVGATSAGDVARRMAGAAARMDGMKKKLIFIYNKFLIKYFFYFIVRFLHGFGDGFSFGVALAIHAHLRSLVREERRPLPRPLQTHQRSLQQVRPEP
jgi:hypothetical protein